MPTFEQMMAMSGTLDTTDIHPGEHGRLEGVSLAFGAEPVVPVAEDVEVAEPVEQVRREAAPVLLPPEPEQEPAPEAEAEPEAVPEVEPEPEQEPVQAVAVEPEVKPVAKKRAPARRTRTTKQASPASDES